GRAELVAIARHHGGAPRDDLGVGAEDARPEVVLVGDDDLARAQPALPAEDAHERAPGAVGAAEIVAAGAALIAEDLLTPLADAQPGRGRRGTVGRVRAPLRSAVNEQARKEEGGKQKSRRVSQASR